MMLPSGNDAAYALAEFFGTQLFIRKYQKMMCNSKMMNLSYFNSLFAHTNIKYFLYEMNSIASRLKMVGTFYDSPHGLSNKFNVSTVED